MLQLIASKARNAVSRDKYRFIDGELDLDLTYITDRVIAMGLPGVGVEKVWRNELEDVARFFKKYHAGHFIIINLSGEVYDYSKFDHRVKDFGYPDHSALPLDLLFRILAAMKYYLDEDPQNIVAVHCLAGRGRTGTVVSSFLLHLGLFNDANEALRYFATTRSSTGEGVITPSQIRYVNYYNSILQGNMPDPRGKEKKLILESIVMEPCFVVPGTEDRDVTGGWTPVVQICTLQGLSPEDCLYSSNNSYARSFNTRDHRECIVNIEPDGCVVQGDIQIRVFHRAKSQIAFMKLVKDGGFKKVEKLSLAQKSPLACLFRVSFHTDWIDQKEMSLKLKKCDLDGMFSGPCHLKLIPDHFQVTLKFKEWKPSSWNATSSAAPPSETVQRPPLSNGNNATTYEQQPYSTGGAGPIPPTTIYGQQPAFPSVPPPFPTLDFPVPHGGAGLPIYGQEYTPPPSMSQYPPALSSNFPPPSGQPPQSFGEATPPPQYFGSQGGVTNLPPLPSAPTHVPYPPATTALPYPASYQPPQPFYPTPPATYTSGMPPPVDPFAPLQFPRT